MKVLLDTNFLVYAAKYKIHLEGIEELIPSAKLFIPDTVISELKVLSRSKRLIERKNAMIALDLIRVQGIEKIKTEKRGDSAFEEIAKKENVAVATLDKELIKRLKNIARIILIRKKAFISEA